MMQFDSRYGSLIVHIGTIRCLNFPPVTGVTYPFIRMKSRDS